MTHLARLWFLLIALIITSFLVHPSPVSAADPGYAGFYPLLYYPCDGSSRHQASPEFHPLRPYPASPCDPFIPIKNPEAPLTVPRKYQTFSCNNTLNTSGTYRVLDFVPDNLPAFPGDCTANLEDSGGANFQNYYSCGGNVCLVHRVFYEFNIGLTDTRLPIVGNTEMPASDQILANTYLDWYLNGTIFQSEHRDINPNDPNDEMRLTTYSGPLNKQLPLDIRNDIKRTIRSSPPVNDQIHNYIVGEFLIFDTRLTAAGENLYKYIPFASLEDVTSEVTVGLDRNNQPASGTGYIIGTTAGSCPDRPFEIALGDSVNGGQSDSRIYISHVRGDAALSDLLASTFRPYPTGTVSSTNTNLYSGEIPVHQGMNDVPAVQVQRYDYLAPLQHRADTQTRNTEVNGRSVTFPDRYRAPDPITTIAPNPECEAYMALTDVGDRVMGKNFNSTLVYYQHFEYTPRYTGTIINCSVEHAACSVDTDCCAFNAGYAGGGCSGARAAGCSGPGPTTCLGLTQEFCVDPCTWFNARPGRCNAWPRRDLPSQARVGVFTKAPLVERLYDTLVVGPQSVLRRFAPKKPEDWPTYEYINGESNLEDTIPGESTANYSGSTSDLASNLVNGGNGQLPVDVYYDRLGSLSNHFLGDITEERLNLQKLLRPRVTPIPGSDGGAPPVAGCTGHCFIPSSGYCSINDPVTQFSVNFPSCPSEAAQICYAESGGSAAAVNSVCPDYSVGLFQINLLCGPNIGFMGTPDGSTLTDSHGRTLSQIFAQYGVRSCYDAWTNDLDPPTRTPKYICQHPSMGCPTNHLTNPGLLAACIDWFSIPQNNVAYARFLSQDGTVWGAWTTARTCGVN